MKPQTLFFFSILILSFLLNACLIERPLEHSETRKEPQCNIKYSDSGYQRPDTSSKSTGSFEERYCPEFPLAAASDTHLSVSQKSDFRSLAIILAYSHLMDGALKHDFLFVPECVTSHFYHALIRIYNSPKVCWNDSMFSKEMYSTPLFRELSQINVQFDCKLSWKKHWKKGKVFTEDETIDKLLRLIKVFKVKFVDYYDQNFCGVTLYLNTPINRYRVNRELKRIKGVIETDFPDIRIPAFDHRALISGNTTLIHFVSETAMIKTQGTLKRHYVEYRITSHGKVTFMGATNSWLR